MKTCIFNNFLWLPHHGYNVCNIQSLCYFTKWLNVFFSMKPHVGSSNETDTLMTSQRSHSHFLPCYSRPPHDKFADVIPWLQREKMWIQTLAGTSRSHKWYFPLAFILQVVVLIVLPHCKHSGLQNIQSRPKWRKDRMSQIAH